MKYFIRTQQKEGEANLHVRICKPKLGVNWWICTGISVDVAEWKKSQNSAKALQRYYASTEGKKVQDQINTVEGILNDFFKSGRKAGTKEKERLQSLISDVINAEGIEAVAKQKKREQEAKERQLHGIVAFYDSFLRGITDGSVRQKRGSKKYREGSVTVWRSFGRYLKEYCPTGLTFEEITKKFADGFVVFLEKKGLMAKTINKHVLCFRRLCNAAAIDEKNTNLISVRVWSEREVKDKEKRAEIALNDEEIDELYNMELTGIREEVRDVWMLGYLSAQRVSDYSHFTRDNFMTTANGVNVIVLEQAKTGNDVVVPILDARVMELCRKYNYNFPKVETRTINRYIKEVLEKLSVKVPSLKELVRTQLSLAERQKEKRYLAMQKRMESGEKLHGDELKYYNDMQKYATEHGSGNMLWRRDFSGAVVKYKWELVSCHTSRRSAVTSLYNSGLFDVRDIMSISGHQTIRGFEGYIKRGSIEQAERIAEKAARAKEIRLKREA